MAITTCWSLINLDYVSDCDSSITRDAALVFASFISLHPFLFASLLACYFVCQFVFSFEQIREMRRCNIHAKNCSCDLKREETELSQEMINSDKISLRNFNEAKPMHFERMHGIVPIAFARKPNTILANHFNLIFTYRASIADSFYRLLIEKSNKSQKQLCVPSRGHITYMKIMLLS